MAAPNYQTSDFVDTLQALMPRGLAWPRDSSSVMTQVVEGLAPTWTRHTQANNYLLVDAFPATSVDLLPEWEAALNLPDPCAGASPTLQGRQNQVVTRLVNSGGQSAPYYIGYAGTLGYNVTVTEFTPFRVGQQAMGAQLGTQDWAYAWQLNAPPVTITYFSIGHACMGQALASWGNAVLECELREVQPAHTILNFAY
ncbi:YmfQ family protein [Trinickia fusca]|uniref:DUF2313 domain-containing protein n=1 Tax=Trinickia fusca TaxID=2419777 RepID=A0A494XIE0_9BURK|nr:putative phage tail protein [Trinickia fusca]RKP50505.1 DUF2313 domain-containing protein [Trinickia fusca]